MESGFQGHSGDRLTLALVFENAVGARLDSAFRFVAAFPERHRSSMVKFDLHHCAPERRLVVVADFDAEEFSRPAYSRLLFWASRAGADLVTPSQLNTHARRRFDADLARSDNTALGLRPDRMVEALDAFAQKAGATEGAARAARHDLEIDLSPDADGDAVTATPHGLFMRSVLAPPVGDELVLRVRLPAARDSHEAIVRVAYIRKWRENQRKTAGGFGLDFVTAPTALVDLLLAHVGAKREDLERTLVRAHPRPHTWVPTRLDVEDGGFSKEHNTPPGGMPAPHPDAAPARALLRYRTREELLQDYTRNLSVGGAFVVTARPPPLQSPVTVFIELPGGDSLQAHGVVVSVRDRGVGIQFNDDGATRAKLEAAVRRLTDGGLCMLLVDEDPGHAQALAESLRREGLQVRVAHHEDEALPVLEEERETAQVVVLASGRHVPGPELLEIMTTQCRAAAVPLAFVVDDADGRLRAQLAVKFRDVLDERDGAPSLAAALRALHARTTA